MIERILAVAGTEMRIVRRNRWILTATIVLAVFGLALAFAGSAPTGALSVDALTIAVASMTTLGVYLIPLIALLMAFDAVAGEVERGGLGLLLTYPVSRGELLAGKFIAHLAALAIATLVGFGLVGAVIGAISEMELSSLIALARLIATSILLGAVFLGIGYGVSIAAGGVAAAAGLSAAVWLFCVVLFDLGLLGAVVYDDGGAFTRHVFPWLLVANPADAFRLWNFAAGEDLALASGMAGAADAVPIAAPIASLLLWPLLAFAAARQLFARIGP